MSLQLIAKQMEAKGRGGDSMLVHMTPDEVAGLQKLAESAGGSLSVNPDTGLVEANFLKKMLPTLVGFGITAATGGAAAPWMVGLGVGGFEALRTGDAKKGLMAGLGAAGGSSLATGIGAAGSQAAVQTAGQKTAEEVAKEKLAMETIQKTAAENAVANAGQAEAANLMTVGNEEAARQALMSQQQQMGADQVLAAQQKAAADYAAQGTGDRLGQGIQALGDTSGREAFAKEFGMKQAAMAAAPMMAPEERKPSDIPVDDEMYSYTYDVGRTGAERSPLATSSERKYFDGRYSPMRKIRASEYGFAEGGETTATDGATGEMSGASKAAFDYLMGERSSSSAGLPALAAQAPVSPASNIGVGGDNMYAFDPATGTFIRNPNYFDRSAAAAQIPGLIGQLIRDSGGGYEPFDPNPGFRGDPNTYSNGLTTALFGGQPAAPVTYIGSDSGGGGTDSWSGGLDSYAGSERDVGDASAAGGLVGLAKGGMASGGFVVPADVVSALGNGSTDAGLRSLNAMLGKIKPIKGKGDGLSDSIKTNIDGKQPARVADGEAYIDPKTVKRVGGAKKLYAMMDKVRAQAHGKTSQQRKVNPAKVMA